MCQVANETLDTDEFERCGTRAEEGNMTALRARTFKPTAPRSVFRQVGSGTSRKLEEPRAGRSLPVSSPELGSGFVPGLFPRTAALVRFLRLAGALFVLLKTIALAAAPPEAVGSLYLAGSYDYVCTASAVEGPELGLEQPMVILTAAHCIEPTLRQEEATEAWTSRQGYLISFDGQEFYAVVPYRVGFAAAGYDIAILLFESDLPDITPLRMGVWENVDFGSPIQNYANPLGLGIQYFTGSVTMLRIEPSPGNQQEQWYYNAVASLQVGPGSSGSLILNEALEYIGVLSGVVEASFGSPFTVFVPQWKISAFLSDQYAARELPCASCSNAGNVLATSFSASATILIR